MNDIIGINIKKIREFNNLSQQEFADKLYVTRQSVSKWENGTIIPDIEKLEKISEIYNISIDSLLKENLNLKKSNKFKMFIIVAFLSFIFLLLITLSFLGVYYYF